MNWMVLVKCICCISCWPQDSRELTVQLIPDPILLSKRKLSSLQHKIFGIFPEPALQLLRLHMKMKMLHKLMYFLMESLVRLHKMKSNLHKLMKRPVVKIHKMNLHNLHNLRCLHMGF